MRRTRLCALITLLAVTSPTSPAESAPVRVSMQQPRMIDADSALLVGRVVGREIVLIERYASSRDRWVHVRRKRADAAGRYDLTVGATSRTRYFRAVAGGTSSQVRAVLGTARIADPDPESPSEPEPPTEPSDECGPRPAKPDGSLWSCTLSEDFDGTELDRTLWQPATGFLGGSEPARPCYVDDPSVISVRDGALRLGARPAPEPVTCSPGDAPSTYIAGGINTYRRFSQQYGRFEARFKTSAATTPGLQEAFWLWPDDRYNTALWPVAGEIDIAETYSQYPHLVVPFLHYTATDNGGPVPGLNTAWDCVAHRGEWNTYALEWSATRLEIFVNGTSCLVNTSGDLAFQKPYIVALTQLLGTSPNAYDGRAPLPAEMTVDHVRVWQ